MSASTALLVLRRRGPGALLGAGYWLARAAVTRRRGDRYLEKTIHGNRMLLDLEDPGLSRTLLLFGTREAEQVTILREVLRPGMTVVDVGANIGYYALLELGILGPEGTLVAIEPSPSNVELLRRNLSLNGYGDVEVLQAAASDEPGVASLHLSEMSNLNTLHPEADMRERLTGETIEVPTVTVQDVARERGLRPDLLRMDIEGHEVAVIGGLLDSIRADELRPMILFEPHINRYSPDNDMGAVLERLFDLGYHVPLVGSSSESGTDTIEGMGYRGGRPIRTDDRQRVIFRDVAPADLVRLVTETGGARTVLLAPPRS